MPDPAIVFVPLAHKARFQPHFNLVESSGAQVEVVDLDDAVERKAVLSRAVAGAVGLDRFRAADFEIAAHLKAIITCTTGVDPIDLEAATSRGVMIGNTPDLCVEEVADHTMMLLLACYRRLPRLIKNSQGAAPNRAHVIAASEKWPRLRGQVLGLLGLGNIAQAVVKRCAPFGLQLIAHDPFVDPDLANHLNVDLVDLHYLLETSDYLSLHAPLNPSTRHLINQASFEQMKPTAFLINASRGPLIDENSLVTALETGQIAGAALDVLEVEPPTGANPLLKMPNVLITPHTAGYSSDASAWGPESAIRDAVQVIQGGRPRSIQNPQVLGSMEPTSTRE
jgi:D-3-phosphoglycerate dehydrogenase